MFLDKIRVSHHDAGSFCITYTSLFKNKKVRFCCIVIFYFDVMFYSPARAQARCVLHNDNEAFSCIISVYCANVVRQSTYDITRHHFLHTSAKLTLRSTSHKIWPSPASVLVNSFSRTSCFDCTVVVVNVDIFPLPFPSFLIFFFPSPNTKKTVEKIGGKIKEG